MTEGSLVAFLAVPGDSVEAGQEIFELETTKIASGVEAPVTGTLRRWVAEPGQVLQVGALVGIMADETVDDAEIDAFIANFTIIGSDDDDAEARPQYRTVDVDGCTIRYQEVKPTHGGGAPLLLIHGFGGDLNNWLLNIDMLARSRAVYVLDLPGHGGSSKIGGDLAMLARTVAGFLRALDLGPVNLGGHSLGGAVALQLALDNPSRIRSLSLIAPAKLGDEINGKYIAGFLHAERHRDLKPIVEMLFHDRGLVTRDMVEDLLKAKRVDGAAAALGAIAAALFPDGRQAVNLRSRLSELAMPVLVLWGSEDAIIPIEHAAGLPTRFRIEKIPHCGHMPHIEAAKSANAAIAEHLSVTD